MNQSKFSKIVSIIFNMVTIAVAVFAIMFLMRVLLQDGYGIALVERIQEVFNGRT